LKDSSTKDDLGLPTVVSISINYPLFFLEPQQHSQTALKNLVQSPLSSLSKDGGEGGSIGDRTGECWLGLFVPRLGEEPPEEPPTETTVSVDGLGDPADVGLL
jgi:hypothetical protein